MSLPDLIQTHWKDVVDIIVYVIAIASIVVKLTPSQADDAKLKKITDSIFN